MDDLEVSQKKIFLSKEGDAFFNRYIAQMTSKEKGDLEDEVLAAIDQVKIEPQVVLEVGCSHGWRLNQIQKKYLSECYGFDPSERAISEGKKIYKDINLSIGTAEDSHSFGSRNYDLIIFGYCLYLCDRQDLFMIAANADKSLADKGFIVIWDYCSDVPYKNNYKHYEGLYSYKMQYSKLFDWNPAYTKVYSRIYKLDPGDPNPDNFVEVAVLMKNEKAAWFENPFKNT